MPRIKLEDIKDKEILRRLASTTKNRTYWAGGFQYYSGMTLSQIGELLHGPESKYFQACAAEWFDDLSKSQVTKAMEIQVESIKQQLARLRPAFEEL